MTIDYSALTPEALSKMTDEEFNQIDPSKLPEATSGSFETTSDQLLAQGSDEDLEEDTEADPISQPTVEEQDNPHQQPTEPQEEEADEAPQVSAEQSEASNEESAEDAPPTNQDTTAATDFYNKVTAKFNASGKEFQVDNADDVISLMQKGIDYNIKMSTLKPALKMVKALEAHGITQEDLGLLIDIHNRKPEAIASLVKQADIDLYSVDEDSVERYAPTDAQITDEEYEFQNVISSISASPRYADVMQFVANSTVADKQEVYSQPQILKSLVEHAHLGIFDKVMAEVDRLQLLGRLPQGMTPLQAYHAIGSQMFGGEPTPSQEQPRVNPQVQQSIPKPVQRPTQQPQSNTARRAAAAPSNAAKTGAKPKPTAHDLFTMSDEEFSKIDPNFL